MTYELIQLFAHPLDAPEASALARAFVEAPEAKGRLLGAWLTEIGVLGEVVLLRGFDKLEDHAQEQHRILMSADPFNAGKVINHFEVQAYQAFPFLPPVETGQFGDFYEFRTYKLKPGGLAPTIDAWKKAMPQRAKMSPLTINMYALDGAPRITHIWPYRSLDERATIRRHSYAEGIWPPKGAPEWILEATSSIAVPESYSPLR